MRHERFFLGGWNRVLQLLARIAPGSRSLRVWLNRWRGVKIGQNVWIGYDCIIETSCPHLVTLRDGSSVGIRALIIAHYREVQGVVVGEEASIGPGAIILPGVTIGQGSIVTAGSVVTASVPPMTIVQGNPARPIARIGVPLRLNVSLKEFAKKLKPIR